LFQWAWKIFENTRATLTDEQDSSQGIGLGSGLIAHSQKMTAAAMQIAEK
jgi:hypothetical protein